MPSHSWRWVISAKPFLYDAWGSDVVCATAKHGPNAGQKVEEMGSEEAAGLAHSFLRTGHDEGQEEHAIRKVFGFEGDNEERNSTGWVVLGVSIGEGEYKG